MKLLLDECINPRLAQAFTQFEVSWAAREGWSSKQNGELLLAAQDNFDVFVTVDKNLQYQQNLTAYRIRIAVLKTHPTTLTHLLPLVPKLEAHLLSGNTDQLFVIT